MDPASSPVDPARGGGRLRADWIPGLAIRHLATAAAPWPAASDCCSGLFSNHWSEDDGMIKRLEQVAALVVAAGLAIVSYWLFFSWAQGGGSDQRRLPLRQQQRSGLVSPAPVGREPATLPRSGTSPR